MGPATLPMDGSRFSADYLIETPLDPAAVAEVMAGEQSCGTFVRVEGETDQLRRRARAVVEAIDELEGVARPSLPNAWQQRQGMAGPYRRARIRISFPVENVGPNLPTLAATVAGNLYDLGEVTGLRLLDLTLPASYRRRFDLPRQGIAGTRKLAGVADAPLLGTIIKPNVGLSPEETGELVGRLCEAGVDFIKDDEVCANPSHAPLEQRVRSVMRRVRAWREKSGRNVMVAFNISDDLDSMRRHAELVEREGGSCVMASLNWCGYSAIQSLRRSTPLALHGHRNGFGMMSREPLLGMSYPAYQALWRLAGVDHLHVHGLNGKFSECNDEVVQSARACLAPMSDGDAVMPVFSNGQWAGTVHPTFEAIDSSDVIFLSGGGILAHPDGAGAGVASLRQAWDAARAGIALDEYAKQAPELQRAIGFYGARLK
ncbi:ribulose-bisphosphate carboxylase large subunit family protein [Herbaspirillum sp. WKF16]|jgi:ribulose-bisphosphate carboxylase large chain|uniref:ribulose-bisphosphate carboxylase large subunit family protein n=1 Tax=Herbaspirillum sp. WKF16 TaxID=3028312 RepID=UPI0023A9EF9F|nr:ribulose-bisphosphate carboxylase large subunit family protein [Herbaspirillum sp. WKF16]WDZ96996.1 ribulose-bisphosphate carboxylase large subunit family protein [Herbaspirillum sp. WKF16]